MNAGAALLRRVREAGGDPLPLKALAIDLGCSIEMVRLLLAGERRPGLEHAVRAKQLWAIPVESWLEPPTTVENDALPKSALEGTTGT